MSEYMSSAPNQSPVTPELAKQLVENAQIVIPEDGIYEKLKSAETEGRQLRVKMGFDPTSPDLHLGHAVSMQQLRKFQELGHLPVIIIGDFTGRIGDPSGRNKSRPLVNAEQIDQNAKTYIDQLSRVLDVTKIEVHRNSEWLEGMNLTDVINLLAQGSLAQIISREDFRKRLDAGSPIGLHEIVYPYLQGMDSVAVNADIEIGGVDQLYAFQAARLLQGNKSLDPEALVLMPLLRGLDGTQKMSKSLGNYIGLSDDQRNMFGKLMSIPDNLISEYLRLASTFSVPEIDTMLAELQAGRNPMEIKLALAHNVTSTYHDKAKADEAEHYFNNQFRRRTAETIEYTLKEIPPVETAIELVVALGAVKSNSAARRLIAQGGLTINGEKITSIEQALDSVDDLKVKIGKRGFYRTKVG